MHGHAEVLADQPGTRRSAPRWLLALALVCAMAPALAGEQPPTRPSDAYIERVAALINEYRSQHRLDRLASAALLEQVADGHSQRMAQSGRPTHGGFRDRFRQVEGAICVENIAAHFDTPEALFEGWRRSPSHDRNLLEPRIVRMGLAAHDRYVTFFACG